MSNNARLIKLNTLINSFLAFAVIERRFMPDTNIDLSTACDLSEITKHDRFLNYRFKDNVLTTYHLTVNRETGMILLQTVRKLLQSDGTTKQRGVSIKQFNVANYMPAMTPAQGQITASYY